MQQYFHGKYVQMVEVHDDYAMYGLVSFVMLWIVASNVNRMLGSTIYRSDGQQVAATACCSSSQLFFIFFLFIL
jgi:hypothetical protein